MKVLITILSSFLWRVRGGLCILGSKLPMNKIWYALAFGFYGCLYYSWTFENWLIGFIDCYTSYQLFGIGLYVGALILGCFNPEERECELIDDIVFSCRITFGDKSAKCFNLLLAWTGLHVEPKTYWLKDYPRLFGFVGISLSGLVITFLWGLYLRDTGIMLSGLGMGVCYWLGYLFNKVIPEQKSGWGYGEWIFGAYEGLWLGLAL